MAPSPGRLVYEYVLPPKSGHALDVLAGQYFRIIDLEGKQCADLAVFNRHNLRDRISPSYSRTRPIPKPGEGYRALDRLSEGDILRSTTCTPLMTIVKETAEPKGIHDTYIRMCNRLLYEMHGLPPQDGCFEIISKVVAPYGILPEDLPDPFNLFLNFEHDTAQGRWISKEPVTKPGDYIEFRAETDCLVALSNCPEDQLTPCSGFKCTPIKVEVRDHAT
jgi:uncharacterized protein